MVRLIWCIYPLFLWAVVMAKGTQVMAAFTALVYRPGSRGTFLAGPLQESDIWIAYLGIFVKRTVIVGVEALNAGVRWLAR